MEYKIAIFSSPECILNEQVFKEASNINGNIIKFSKIEKVGTLEIKQIIAAIIEGYDGIFVIIRGEKKGDQYISKYNSFLKVVDEANRILKKRSFEDVRIYLYYWIGGDYKSIIANLKDFIRKIEKCGLNPLSCDDSN